MPMAETAGMAEQGLEYRINSPAFCRPVCEDRNSRAGIRRPGFVCSACVPWKV